jgi:branched-chain amino acid aminotransferase
MRGQLYWENGLFLPVEKASVPLDDPWFSGGYGVYETLKCREGLLFFPELHQERLLNSARLIGLEPPWPYGSLEEILRSLLNQNRLSQANLRVMILGDHQAGHSRCVAFCQEPPANSPKQMGQAPFPQPTSVRTYTGERLVPQAKTLGLLVSLMFRRQAEAQGAYEALLINRKGEITEGTKSNFLVLEGQTILSPPKEDILWGVTLRTLQEATVAQGYRWEFRPLPLEQYQKHPGAFLTSTSVNVLPIGHWGENKVTPSAELHRLHEIYQRFLMEYVRSYRT